MFRKASLFNGPVNLDTSQVTAMENMFDSALSFNYELYFNTSNVLNMKQMFINTREFNKPLNFDTSQVTEMWSMFSAYLPQNGNNRQVYNFDGRSLLTTSFGNPLELINQNQADLIINIHRLAKKNGNANLDEFSECYSESNIRCFTLQTHSTALNLVSGEESHHCNKDGYELEYIDLEFNIPDLKHVFQSCQNLLEVAFYPVDSIQANDTSYMFHGALLFNGPVGLDTSQVRDMSYMFREARSLNHPISLQTSSVTNMQHMYVNTNVFDQTVNLDDTSRVTSKEYVSRCTCIQSTFDVHTSTSRR